ncbi:threonine--tRNA ligase [Brevibacillus sp. 7WMA2]|uniref:Threonine--tRNA ligase n=1 Tax=Brevibacillus laterosporus LMG 15441 TaxID=1042163 RepID=A0A075R2I4_BRELA|nr:MULTISPECIES: threonine--tRNA ligase [Brevibacillus]AIG25423.1 threonine--tRNA ligase 2 [Brevibacillus laterosporus LMG 15441]AUM63987.1 threonine--tRNA ligase [Brevibacillus laterosporus]AYK06969.1 threonine--tRNA ligase [Brevibacillus laterosporus]ERM19801.1 threonyl-tRNA synthetase [Brevibacillus laterosporus PE36]MBA4531370.1 threonine--tRNA ligase [Brevibacillus halotolerans]
MAQVKVTLPDGSIREYEAGVTIEDIAGSISTSLKKKAIAGKVNGKVVDVTTPIHEDTNVEIVTLDTKDGLEVYRHSTAHLLAQAVKRVFGNDVKLGIGPVIEDGFYYDMDIPVSLAPEDLIKLEAEMNKIIKENLKIERKEVSREEALRIFGELNDHLKLELIRDLPEGSVITMYHQGEFFDLCRGPHLPSTGVIKAFKLMSVAGAYWRGNSDNQVLQRVYGTAFPKKAELDEHLHFLEEAKKRDHRKLGKELSLYMFSEEAPGMPFYLPNGMTIRNELEQFSRRLQDLALYEEVRTPFMMNQRLWEQSGHWDHYHENMYFSEVDNTTFALKPMNCPGHMLIYKNEMHSYRDLPIRYSEFGQVHRHEFSGALNGMLRVRTFCQDDAHVFVRPDQIEAEIKGMIQLIDRIYSVFGFKYSVELSTRPEDSMGSDELWEIAENSLKNVLDELGMEYEINEGDGAFYGPKIDFQITDALKRSHQCGTIQLDFQLPEKFDLSYIGQDNEKHRPVVLHRAMYGSLDRFIGILVEHYGGAFPTWLAPIQARLMTINEVHVPYAEEVRKQLLQAGIRVELDSRNEKIGYKIREAQMQKIPYMLVIGEKEMEEGALSVRKRGEGDLGSKPVAEVLAHLQNEILERK